MKARPGPKGRTRIKDAQVLAEQVVAGMMAKDRFSQLLGMQIVDVRPRTATVRMTVRPDMVNGFGVAHGAVAFALADSAFAFACNTHGKVTVSIENSITYPVAIMPGDVLTATAGSEGESRRLGYYRAEVRNQRDEVVALFRGTAYKTKGVHGQARAEGMAADAPPPRGAK
ncbi:MAG: hydroxyphenylacetyl-CoA thioesterase PaaI [Gemmatimonadota bacterium]|nr:hydroxyphenylacetyl-CoA thioesterase PaaI [Gemmatimonadota bacterium]